MNQVTNGGGGHRADGAPATATILRPLAAYETAPPGANRPVAVILTLVGIALGAAMPLVWHHVHVPGGTFTVVHGFNAQGWLVVVAALALLAALRASLRAPGLALKWGVTGIAFTVVLALCADYIDWSQREVTAFVAPYFGPGFFLALGAAVLSVAAAILAWREPV